MAKRARRGGLYALLGGSIFKRRDLTMQLYHSALMTLGAHGLDLNITLGLRLQDP